MPESLSKVLAASDMLAGNVGVDGDIGENENQPGGGELYCRRWPEHAPQVVAETVVVRASVEIIMRPRTNPSRAKLCSRSTPLLG